MDAEKKAMWKFFGGAFALLIAGSWIWSWIFPSEPIVYVPPVTTQVETPSPSWQDTVPNTYYSPCDDEVTVEDYKYCMEEQALEDWQQDREGEAGLP
jgi:hypothetical protein